MNSYNNYSVSGEGAVTATTTTAMRKALTAELMEIKSQSDLLANAGFIITPDDPRYGLSANEANEVCEKVLGKGKYNLFVANGRFVGVMCNFI